MIRYLIDANCVVYALGGESVALRTRIADCAPGQVVVSAITYAEVAYGTYVGKPPPQDVLDAFLRAIPLLAFDEEAARQYARLPFKRARFDRLLAAHALALDAVVVTKNEANFADVPGLRVENWTV